MHNCNHSANEIENNFDDNGLFLSQKLSDISAGRIDELCLIASELRSSLQFMSFSETWAHKEISDSELETEELKGVALQCT